MIVIMIVCIFLYIYLSILEDDVMNKFLTSNETKYRLLRTILQGVIGVVITYAADIIGQLNLDPVIAGALVALIMAVLSPIMATIGKEEDKEQ